MDHTILLLQYTEAKSSRTFMDYKSVSKAMDGICAIFEKRLREMNPTRPQITYEVRDLFNWIDNLGDLSALVFDNATKTYVPYNKQWVKENAYRHLQGQIN